MLTQQGFELFAILSVSASNPCCVWSNREKSYVATLETLALPLENSQEKTPRSFSVAKGLRICLGRG